MDNLKYYYIMDATSNNMLFNFKALLPKKIKSDDLKSIGDNYLFSSAPEALTEFFKEWDEITISNTWEDFKKTPILRWKNRTSLFDYILSRLAILLVPFVFLLIPIFKYRINKFKRYINEEYPEWLI